MWGKGVIGQCCFSEMYFMFVFYNLYFFAAMLVLPKCKHFLCCPMWGEDDIICDEALDEACPRLPFCRSVGFSLWQLMCLFHAFCFSSLLRALHCTVLNYTVLHCTALHWTAHCTAHCKLQTAHCTLHTAHCTLYPAHCTLYTAHCTLHTAHCTLHFNCPLLH